jgi:hypothetical protein
MTRRDLGRLAVLTLKDPGRAARIVIAMDLPRKALWEGLVLSAALNAILFALSDMMFPAPQVLPSALHQPLVYFSVVLLGLVVFIQALALTGRLLGGSGGFAALLPVMVWFQVLRVAVQAASLLLLLTLPFLSLLFIMAAAVAGVYVLLHFLSEALRLGSLGRAAGAMILASLVVIVAASVFIALFGAPIPGSV